MDGTWAAGGWCGAALGLAGMLMVSGGCEAGRRGDPLLSRPVAVAPLAPSRFPASASILSGFDIASEGQGGEPRAGDRVLLGVTVTREGEELVRMLEIELTEASGDPPLVEIGFRPQSSPEPFKFISRTTRTLIRVYDERGQLLAHSRGSIPDLLLALGPYDAAMHDLQRRDTEERAGEASPPVTSEEVERGALGWMSLVMFSGAMRGNSILSDLVDQVIQRPSLIAMLLSPTIQLEDGPGGPAVAPGGWTPETAAPSRPACRVPLEVRVAGTLVIRTTMLVTRCSAPLGLCGGLLSLDGEKADDSSVRVHIELLAARRGKGGDSPVAAAAP